MTVRHADRHLASARAFVASALGLAASLGVVGACFYKRPPNQGELLGRPFALAMAPAIVAIAIAALALLLFGPRIERASRRAPRLLLDFALFVGALLFAHHILEHGLGGVPRIQDEIAYDLLARRFSIGTPLPRSPPLGEFFVARFMIDDGHAYPLFQPGFPAFLAIFRVIGATSWGPSAAVALLVVSASRLAERLYGRVTSLLAAALVVASGFVEVIGSTFFAHAFAAALACLSVEQLMLALETSKRAGTERRRAWVPAAIGGLAAGWLFFARLPAAAAVGPAVLLAAAAGSLEFASFRSVAVRREALLPLAVFAGCALVGVSAQLLWDAIATGNPLVLPQDRYFDLTEPVKSCHRVGFGDGIGCPREHRWEVQPGPYTLRRAVDVTFTRFSVLRDDAWGTPWPFLVLPAFFVRRLTLKDAIALLATIGPFALYFGFYYHANQYGARLYGDAMGALSVTIAASATAPLTELAEQADAARLWPRLGELAARALPSLGLAVLLFVVNDEIAIDLPERVAGLAKMMGTSTIADRLDAEKIHHAVVFVARCGGDDFDRADVHYGWASIANDPRIERGDRIVARDFGAAHDAQLTALYPDRRQVRVDCGGNLLQELPQTPRPGFLHEEWEAKYPPLHRDGCYGKLVGDYGASNGGLMDLQCEREGGSLSARQYVPTSGAYAIRGRFRAGSPALFALYVDGNAVDPPIDARGRAGFFDWSASSARALSAGQHVFEVRLVSNGNAPAGTKTHLGVDYFELERQGP